MAVTTYGSGTFGASPGGGPREYGITVTLPQIPLLVPAEARRALNALALDTLRLALQVVAGHVSDEAPVDSGALGQSFGSDPATATGGLELLGADLATDVQGRVFSTLPYAVVMAEGRQKGAPISRAGIDAIGLWAQRKLGLSADDAASAKWAIAQAIIARGLQGTDYFGKGIKAAQPTVDQLFTALSQAIAQQLTSTQGER